MSSKRHYGLLMSISIFSLMKNFEVKKLLIITLNYINQLQSFDIKGKMAEMVMAPG